MNRFSAFLAGALCAVCAYAYSVWNGCPDFMDLQQTYVEGFYGTFENPLGTTGLVDDRHKLNTQQETDANTGDQLTTIPNGETKSIRLGNEQVGSEAEAIVYHFKVDPQQSLLFVNFAVVLEDPGHESIYQPRFVVRITDAEGNLVSDCAEYDVSAAAGLSGFQDYLGGHTAVRWRDWTKVGLDLTPFAGQEVQVQFITYDCALMGHFGYAYFTAHCAPNKLEVEECLGDNFTIAAPEGFASYLWDNGDTTRTTTRTLSDGDLHLTCTITSVTGCSFTQSAFVSSSASFSGKTYKDTICQGEPYNKHNFNLSPQYNVGTTTYTNILLNPTTCSEEGEEHLELTILQQFYDINASICEGEDYTENGFTIQQPPVGVLFDTLRFSKDGKQCDSVVCLRLTVSETLHINNQLSGDETPCTGIAATYSADVSGTAEYSWVLPDNATILNGGHSPQIVLSFSDDTPGIIILKGENGCGSNAVPMEIRPRKSYHQLIKDTSCVNETYDRHGFNLGKFTQSGYYTYTQSLTSKNGCDSTVVLSLTVFDQPTISIETDAENLLCQSDKVTLTAKGKGGNNISVYCDSLPIAIGDVFCSDGTFARCDDFLKNPNGRTAAGVVFHVQPDYQYALVADLKDVEETRTLTWGNEGFDLPNLPNHTHVREVMTDQDGYGNTAIIRKAGDATLYPVAWAVDFENGWYVPAIGELRMLFATTHEVNETLAKIGGQELPSNTNQRTKPCSYFSSTELSAYFYCGQTSTGEIYGSPKSRVYSYLRAVRSVPLSNIEAPKVKIGDLVQNEFGEKGIAFRLTPDGKSGWMVALEEDSNAYIWNSELTDIANLPNHFNEEYAANCLTAEQDWEGYENTKNLRKAIDSTATIAAWSVNLKKGWFLPSAGQMGDLYALLPTIDSALTRNNGTPIYYDSYWTSSEMDSTYAWTYDMAFGNADAYRKDLKFYVRAISSFTYCGESEYTTDTTLTFRWEDGSRNEQITVYPTETSTYTVTATNKEGCAASASRTLYVTQGDIINRYDTICQGETYKDELFEESKTGIYSKEIQTNKCNQTVRLHLLVKENHPTTHIEDTICQGASYRKNGFYISTNIPGVMTDSMRFADETGCDSMVQLQLSVKPMPRDTLYNKVCQNEVFEESGFSIAAQQSVGLHYFERRTTDGNGCPSATILALTVDSVYQKSLVDTICQAEHYNKNGFDFIANQEEYQTAFQTYNSKNGCDSIISLTLKILQKKETIYTDTIVIGETYRSQDFQLPAQTEMGWQTFYRHLQTTSGCDSLITLNLYVRGDDEVVDVPDAFTPQNHNGANDVFMPGYEVFIYDRYGLLICHSKDGWDGKYRGVDADPGVYIYTLRFKSGKEKRGTVEIFKN